MKYFKNDTNNIYTNGTDVPNNPSHKEVTQADWDEMQAIRDEQAEKDAIKQKIKNGDNVSLKDLTKVVADLI